MNNNGDKIINDLQKSGSDNFKKKMLKTIESYKNLSDEDKNCLHIYYGYGKGKTTSALGLAVRAIGAGKKVIIIQFDKGYENENEHYSERHILRRLKEFGYPIEIHPTGCERMNPDGTFRFKNNQSDFDEAKRALKLAEDLIIKGDMNLLILDEAIAAVAYNLLKKEEIENLIDIYKKNKRFELVMTGHKIWDYIDENADLITEMRKVKHYFDKGIPAREGIEF
ncbi:MAG: cob(I)yrinic acid a,c-diamide adenosyltransferase [Ignavibacteria bacterium]|nr:cob(I)yrinic acid a,c-diamide adenosyltransferase [Ignavibacteria bacterium]